MDGNVRWLGILHIEDEPWDWDFIPDELAEAVRFRFLGGRDGGVEVKVVSEANKYPCHYLVRWSDGHGEAAISYWLLEDAGQVAAVSEKDRCCTFILDVMRSNVDGQPVSSWRKSVQVLSAYIKSVNEQVRLYTAYEMTDDAEEELDVVESTVASMEPPPVIDKGQPELYDYIISRWEKKWNA